MLDNRDCKEAVLGAFEAGLSAGVNELIVDGSTGISLSWLDRGFNLLRVAIRSFAKLVEEDLGYPKTEWEQPLVDDYLSFTLYLLDIFNSISSSLAHLRSTRLALAHALQDGSTSRLKPIDSHPRKLTNWAGTGKNIAAKDDANQQGSGSGAAAAAGAGSKEAGSAIRALEKVKGFAYWVCGVMIWVLGGEIDDNKYWLDIKGPAPQLDKDGVGLGLGLGLGVLLKEVEEVNDAVASATGDSDDDKYSLQTKLQGFGKQLEGAEKEVRSLFSEVMQSRNHLLDCLRITCTTNN